MTLTPNLNVDVLRPGSLTLGWVGHLMFELQQLPVSWQNIKTCQLTKTMPFDRNVKAGQLLIIKCFYIC